MAQWQALMAAAERRLCIGGKLVFGSGVEVELDGSMVMELSIEEGADGALLPGAVLSAVCTLELANESGQWRPGGSLLGNQELIGATLMPKLGADGGKEVFWRSLGVFQVESAAELEQQARLRIRALDSISFELADPFVDTLHYPARLQDIWNAAVSSSRYLWSGSVPNGEAIVDSAPDWKGASLRTIFGWIAAAAGCFVRVGRDGKLELCPVNGGKSYAVGPDNYFSFEKDSVFFGPVDCLRVTPVGQQAGEEEERLYCGASGEALHGISLRGNPLFIAGAEQLDELAEGMLRCVAGLGSASLKLRWRGDPDLQIGDRLSVTDTRGGCVSGVLSRQTLRFAGGFSADAACAVPEASQSGVRRAITPEGGLNAAALVGTVNGGLLSAGSVTADKLAAGSVTAEKLAANIIDAVSIDAVTAKIEKLTASQIETDRLAAALASFTVITAGSASFDRATVQHLVANAMNLSFGVGDTVFISNLRASYAQIVNAAIGNLCIKASDGNYYAIDVDASGNVSATPTGVSDGEISAGQTGAGRVILGTDISAESLNTSSLLATYALVNKIDAARIDVDQLFARKAFIDLLATSQIAAGKSLTIIAGEAAQALEAAKGGVAGVEVEYYLSTSSAAPAGGSWSTAAPEWTAGRYMWSRTKTILKDGSASASDPVCIAGAKGDSGVGVAAITAQYYLSDSKSALSGGSWLNVAPEWEAGKYMWTRSMVVYSDGNTAYTEPCADSGWELADEAAKLAGAAQDAADQAKNAAQDALTRQEFERVVRIDAAGMHVGDNQTASEVLIDSGTVNVVVGGHSYSSFGSGYLQLGGEIRMRRPKGGGVAFSPVRLL